MNIYLIYSFDSLVHHEGLGDSYRQFKVIAARGLSCSYKTFNRSCKWTFGIGHWEKRIFILIKAAATIRNYMVLNKIVFIICHGIKQLYQIQNSRLPAMIDSNMCNIWQTVLVKQNVTSS